MNKIKMWIQNDPLLACWYIVAALNVVLMIAYIVVASQYVCHHSRFGYVENAERCK
jgi:hypothetical protein